MPELKNKIRELMEEENVTAYSLAKQIGYSETAIHNWLDGKYEPKRIALKALADRFNVPLSYFYQDLE